MTRVCQSASDAMTHTNTLGWFLSCLREEREWDLEETADKLGVSPLFLQALELGELRMLPHDVAAELCKLFDVGEADLRQRGADVICSENEEFARAVKYAGRYSRY